MMRKKKGGEPLTWRKAMMLIVGLVLGEYRSRLGVQSSRAYGLWRIREEPSKAP
jgi:hypothetical protein